MSDMSRINIVQQAAQAISQGDSGVYERVMIRDFYNYSPAANEETAPEVFGRVMADLSAAFPDFEVNVADFDEDGDEVSFSLTLSGTHSKNLWGAPGSGKSGTWTSAAAVRFSGDKFAFHWPNLAVPDILGALRHIDLVPPAEEMDKPPKHPISIPEIVLKTLFTGQMADKECSHLEDIQITDTTTDVCNDCVARGDIWPALRMCLTCGYVGCCDTSANKHMKAHYEKTGHPLFRSVRLEESWIWCYEDNAMFSGKVLDKFR